jgi:hypothetical protein
MPKYFRIECKILMEYVINEILYIPRIGSEEKRAIKFDC